MTKIDDAKIILQSVGMPEAQQSDMGCLSLLGLAHISETDSWTTATNEYTGIHDIIGFVNESYQRTYAENTRENFRKKALHHFRTAAIAEDNGKATNSPNYKYRLTNEALELIKSYGGENWETKVAEYRAAHGTLVERYTHQRQLRRIPLLVNGKPFTFSPGPHNELHKAIIDQFVPRFAGRCSVLYIGDTEHKVLLKDDKTLQRLGIIMGEHEKLPDIILYRKCKNWIYFIEAVTTVGPISPKRILEIEDISKKCKAGKVYVTAFKDLATYRKFSTELAWETEVWVSEFPNHMIHLNGSKFLGPYRSKD